MMVGLFLPFHMHTQKQIKQQDTPRTKQISENLKDNKYNNNLL